jgi:hypothetical protein
LDDSIGAFVCKYLISKLAIFTSKLDVGAICYGYIVLNVGILIDIMYRSSRLNESSWDLFGLIFLGGLVTTVHQYRYKIFTKLCKIMVHTRFADYYTRLEAMEKEAEKYWENR